MRYECERCGERIGTLDPPHLCADVRRRYERQERLIALIEGVLARYGLGHASREIAEQVYRALRGRWYDE